MTKSELLLKSSGGRPGEAAQEEENRQQWWSPVGWQVFYFAFSWELFWCFLVSFRTFRFLISMVRWFLLRADHCLYSFKSDQVNVLKIFCYFLAATRVGPGHFSNISYMIRYKIYPSSHFSWLFQEHKRLFCKKHVNCLKAFSNVHF